MLRTIGLALNFALAGEAMIQPSVILQEFETIYAIMHPPREKTSTCCLWLTGLQNPFFNIVQHLSLRSGLAEKVNALIAEDKTGTLSFWIDRKRDSSKLIDVLERKGFQNFGAFPLMAWECAKIECPSQFDIRPAEMTNWKSIVAQMFCLDEPTAEGFTQMMIRPEAENYLIYFEGKPVGTGTILISGDVGGIFNIATLPEYQKRGLGRAMTQFLMHRAWEKRLHRLILISAPLAQKLYASIGFRTDADIEVYSRHVGPVVAN